MLKTVHSPDAQALAAEAYVLASFGLRLNLVPHEPTGLPHFLIDRYRLWTGTLLRQSMLLVAGKDRRPGMGFISDFQKHRDLLRHQLGIPLVILLLHHAPAAVRRQLVERGVGFLAPGSHLYIPEALLDIRERGPRVLPEPGEQLTPTAQLILVAVLLGERLEAASLTELARRFGVAVMSMSRALDELEALRVAEARRIGRQRRLHLPVQGRELWHGVKDRLQSPVRKVRTVRGTIDADVALRAGESALARYTMLGSPRTERRAIAAARWREIAPHLVAAAGFEDDRREIETWSYDPKALVRGDTVDPLSLYLSVRHDPDERIAQAAEQLLEPFGW